MVYLVWLFEGEHKVRLVTSCQLSLFSGWSLRSWNGERTSVGGWSGCLHVSHEYCTPSRPEESSHKSAGDDGAEHLFLLV